MQRHRNNQLLFRLSDTELALFIKKQTASKLNKTEFLLRLLKSATIKVYDFEDTARQIYGELRKIGVNLNQIAYYANSGYMDSAKAELSKMQTAYLDALDRLKKFLENPMMNAVITEKEKPPSEDGE